MTATTEFQDACTLAEGVRQEAVRSAQNRFRIQRQAELMLWGDELDTARKAFDALKVEAEAAGGDFDQLPEELKGRYLAAQAELTRLETQPDGKALRDALDADLRAADAAYQLAVAQLRPRFGIS